MMAFVTHRGGSLLTSDEVLKEFGLNNGQSISEDMLWEIIAANAAQFSAEMKLRKAQGLEAPDTTALDEKLARRNGQ